MKTAGVSFEKRNISFEGHKKYSNKQGIVKHKFFYNYDTEKFQSASLEIVPVYSENGVWKYKYNDKKKEIAFNNNETIALNPEQILPGEDFYGYRFKLVDKSGKDWYDFDAGIVTDIDDEGTNITKFNVVSKKASVITKNGPMQLVFIDSESGYKNQATGEVAIQSEQSEKPQVVRSMFNRLDGRLSDVTNKLDKLQQSGYARVVFTPFTDGASSHEYWTRNAFRVSPSLGTYNDFKKLIRKSLETGVNIVADGAFVNEGLDGDHFSHMLKWGKDSPYYNWFKAQGLEDGALSLGIIPEKASHVRYRLVNSPYDIHQDHITKKIYTMGNDSYINTKPTHIQFYDDRLASEEQIRLQRLFSTYKNKQTGSHYDIARHNDSIYPYSFEIDPSELKQAMNEFNKSVQTTKTDPFSAEGAKSLLRFSNFEIGNKKEGGFELWNGNVDVAKFNFYTGNQDQAMINRLPADERENRKKALERGVYQVRDYAISAGRYWTKLTYNEMLKQTARNFKDVGTNPLTIRRVIISDKFKKNPAAQSAMTSDVVQKVINNTYNLRVPKLKNDYQEFLMKELMDFPLESIEASRDVIAVLSSPYISKRANAKEELGVNRYDLKKIGYGNLPDDYVDIYTQTNAMYEQLFEIVKGIYDKSAVNLTGEFSASPEILGDYGKYVVKIYTQELVKYLIIKSLDPNSQIHINDVGEMNFDELKTDDISLATLKIKGNSPKGEARVLIKRIQKGLSEIPESEKNKLAHAIAKNLQGVDLNSFRLAEAMVDRTEAGLGWRIDAAKDIASVDALLDGEDDFETFWNAVIDFWGNFNKEVLKENPHAYTVAEVTDLNKFLGDGVPRGEFLSERQAIQQFLERSKITTIANYFYAFSTPIELFAKGIETGSSHGVGQTKNLHDNLKAFLYSTPLAGILNSYVFSGNHDKPRLMHLLSLDMDIFYSDFKTRDEIKVKNKVTREANNAIKEYNKKIESYRRMALDLIYPDLTPMGREDRLFKSELFDRLSPKAVAMGLRLKKGFDDVLKDSLKDKDENEINFIRTQIHKALADLTMGKYKNTKFPQELFGVSPIDITLNDVLEQMEYNLSDLPYNKIKLDEKSKKLLLNNALESILTPSQEKAKSIYKLIAVIPGSPTDFSGDFLGMSGYETKKGNNYQQNRNLVPYDWLNDENKAYIKNFYNDMNEIAQLRTKPELSSLNDGMPVLLSSAGGKNSNGTLADKVTVALYRYNDKGSETISIFDAKNAHPDNNYGFDKNNYEISPIRIDKISPKIGLMGGLSTDKIFKNINDEDQSEYVVVSENGEYWLKQRIFYEENGERKSTLKNTITMRANDNNVVILYRVHDIQSQVKSRIVPLKWVSGGNLIAQNYAITPSTEAKSLDMRA